jgi:hypothetical protein
MALVIRWRFVAPSGGGCSRPLTLTDLAYKFIGGMSGSTWITDCFCNGLDFP